MGVDAEDLIIRPFKELVELGKDTVSNAESVSDNVELFQRMVKAGRAVCREGERAVKRIQTIWDDQVERYGSVFKTAIVQQDSSIESKRRVLDDLLYDFEDYTEPDMFDGDKFVEIQAAAKSLALEVIDVTKRLKLEAPKVTESPSTAFPPLPPLPPLPPIPRESRWITPHLHTRSPLRTTRPGHGMLTPTSPVNDTGDIVNLARANQAINVAQTVQVRSTKGLDARSPAHTSVVNGMVDERRPSSPDILGHQVGKIQISGGPSHVSNGGNASFSQTSSWVRRQDSLPRPRQPLRTKASRETVGTEVSWQGGLAVSRYTAFTDSSTRSNPPSVFDPPTSPVLTGSRTSYYSNANSNTSSTGQPSPLVTPDPRLGGYRTIPPATLEPAVEVAQDSIKFDPVPTVPPITLPPAAIEPDFDDGLMLAEEVVAMTDSGVSVNMPNFRGYSRVADCVIGLTSSFRQLGGLCQGGETFRTCGQERGVKRTMGFFDNQHCFVGQCVSCAYYHSDGEVRLDFGKKSEGTLTASGVHYRIRLLFKSHLSANNSKVQRLCTSAYACLFCVQTGSTIREGDATVFTSPDALLAHLARHPQPLPAVSGVTVLYGTIDPTDPRRNDFDLHLPAPPAPSLVPPDLVGRSAVATAVAVHFVRPGARKLGRPRGFDGELLTFLIGARVVGLAFPEQWKGKWCSGWHDGKSGVFNAKCVEVEPPQHSEVPMESSSGMSVVARWQWKPPQSQVGDRGVGWLAFEKGDVISNVRCLYADHWCWSGTNKRGEFGVFPQSHLILETLTRDVLAPLGGVKKAGRANGLFGRRPVDSSAASSMSGGSLGRSSTFS